MLCDSTVFDWSIGGGRQSYYGLGATTITLTYLWRPYIILPVYAGMLRALLTSVEAGAARRGDGYRAEQRFLCRTAAFWDFAGTLHSDRRTCHAFALSFDEIIVTTFTAGPGATTVPIWIFANVSGPTRHRW